MAYTDRYGVSLSTPSAAAAEQYGAGIDIMLALNDGARDKLEAAITHDEHFTMAHIALARWFQPVRRRLSGVALRPLWRALR